MLLTKLFHEQILFLELIKKVSENRRNYSCDKNEAMQGFFLIT